MSRTKATRSLQGATLSCAILGLCAALFAGCGDDDSLPPSPVGGFGASDAGGTGGVAGEDDGGGGMSGSAGSMDASMDSAVSDASDNDTGTEDAATHVPAPDGWLCHDRLFQDGYCDCGCGAVDTDCQGIGCVDPGCMALGCEACFSPSGAWVPCTPEEWTCEPAKQGDALGFCDCGCGAPDPDCQGRGCTSASCRSSSCNRCHDDSGTVVGCDAPAGWSCALSAYASGDGCDCGCGIADPDCGTEGCVDGDCRDDACNTCRSSNRDQVPCDVPNEWLCNPLKYDSNDGCDCGCGVADPDCDNAGCEGNSCTDESCQSCHFDGATGVCTIPTAWTCHPVFYARNGVCDCGCGAIDPDCGSAGCTGESCTAAGCDLCHGEQGAFADCGGWTCDVGQFGTGDGCDCGCGATDTDCLIFASCTEPGCESEACENCNDAESNRTECGGGWTCSLENYGDGYCDCGCGIADPDCADAGCTERGCIATSCDQCRDENGRNVPCEVGICAPRNIGTGDGCDCGCAAVDPDCAGLSACTQPGCSAAECARCRDPLGRLINCL